LAVKKEKITRIESPDALSKDWQIVRFDQMAKHITDRVDNPSEAGVERYVGLEHLDPESLKIRRWGSPEDVEATKLRFKPGDIIFGKRRAYQRKLAVAAFEGICSAHAMVLRAREDTVVKEFLPFFMQSDIFFDRALAISVGSLSPTINWKTLASQQFVIPPKNEQQRIADILWAADVEKRSLLQVIDSLQELIIATGDKAFFNNDYGDKISLGKLAKDGKLGFQTGPFGTVLKASSYVTEGTPIVNPVNMKEGKLIIDDGPFLSKSECERLSRFKLKHGDVILGRKGDVGRAIYIVKGYEGYILGSDCIRVRLHTDQLNSRYFYYFLISAPTRRLFSRLAFGTTMPGINEGLLSRIELVIPSIVIQCRTIELFERLDSTTEIVQKKLEANSSLIKALINKLLDPFSQR
jgi:type I restriction enzyme, S subunit